MQFQVPQFLDVEDKIFGPLSFKQLIYLAGGGGLAYFSWYFIPFVGIIVAIACIAFGAALAFYKYNKKPFVYILEAGFNFYKGAKFYVWKQRPKDSDDIQLDNFRAVTHTRSVNPQATSGNLNNLSWNIDVQGGNEVTAQKGQATDAL